MNERLKEFEKESNLEIFGLGARREVWERALEKFAELIVRECAQELSRVPGGYDSSVFYKNSKILKEHFGVEE